MPLAQSVELKERCDALRVPCKLTIIPGAELFDEDRMKEVEMFEGSP